METLFEVLEAIMVICFGISWPMSIIKSYKSRTTKGKSLFFLFLIWIGYVSGVTWKILVLVKTGEFRYPAYFYIFNLIMVSIDIILYFRNKKLDREAEKK